MRCSARDLVHRGQTRYCARAMPTQLLTIDDVAARLRVSRRAVFTLMKQPTFPARVRLGARTVRVSSDDLDAWIASQLHAQSPRIRAF